MIPKMTGIKPIAPRHPGERKTIISAKRGYWQNMNAFDKTGMKLPEEYDGPFKTGMEHHTFYFKYINSFF